MLRIDSLILDRRNAHAEGTGTLQLFSDGFQLHDTLPFQARLKFNDAEPGDFVDGLPVKGSFQGEIQIDGDLHSIQAIAGIRGSRVAYENILLGDMDAGIGFKEGRVLLESMQMKNNAAVCRASGELQLFEPRSWQVLADPNLKAEMTAEAISLADYVPVEGRLDLSARVEGPLSNLQGSGHIEAREIQYQGQCAERMVVDVRLSGDRLHILPLQLDFDPQNVVTGSGWIDFEHRFSFELSSEGFHLKSLAKIREMEAVDGKMDFHVRGEGGIEDPAIFADIRLKELYVNSEQLEDCEFHVKLIDNLVSVEGRQTFELKGDYHLSRKDFHLNLIFRETDVTPLLLALGVRDFEGILSGRIAAEGKTEAILMSKAVLDVTGLALNYRGQPFVESKKIHGTLRNQSFSVPQFRLKVLQSGEVRIKGTGNFDGSFDLSAEGEMPAESALFFLEDVANIEGKFGIRAEVKGTAADPEMMAEIVFQEVGFTLATISSSFKDINGKIMLTPKLATIENIVGRLDSGSFRIGGEAVLEKFRIQKVRMALTARQLPILVPQTMEMEIDADLTAEGAGENIKIEGDVTILEGVYYKRIKLNLLQKVKERRRVEEPVWHQTGHSILERVLFNVRLKYREPFIVDNNIAYLEIQPDFQLSGTLAAPVITGTARVQEGTITYQRKSFVVNRGIISFVNPYRIEPEIDIAGSIKIRQWIISLTVSGSPDRLTVELSSKPPEDDADIVSLLVFGKTTGEIKGGEEGAVTSNEALLALLMASSFGDDVKKATGLDYLEVESAPAEAEEQADTVKVLVGKDLSTRLSVKYKFGAGSTGYDQRMITEYKLLENILLSGFQDNKGSYGGEIVFRLEFR
ncbi:MAG: translocation/assembly module TamB domain-containing protein [Deltaproteobacteria bacterium]